MNNPNNLLGNETSPYLLQHADNPVNWHPWNAQALELARAENKPVLLSIGYSACHWCHVMAHESFEDAATADIMNRHFINIKVDREERPDLDKIYQAAHSLLTGRPGGWPLTVFLTPHDQMPFFAGTYFPKQRHHGMPAFSELLLHIHRIYIERSDDIREQNRSLKEMLQNESDQPLPASQLNALPLDMARRQLISAFDEQHGGFGKAPKFPHPSMLERALRQWCLTCNDQQDDQALFHLARYSLQRMAMGGLFDHLGGGFCRYSTDDTWTIPHFEKMLYDNGQLLVLYTRIWQLTRHDAFLEALQMTAEWIQREMQSASGGYYSAQDADSEGIEGKYYVWTPQEIAAHLDAQDYSIFAACYALDQPANFEHHWHLYRQFDNTQLAERFNQDEHHIQSSLQRSRKTLLDIRRQRQAPGTDDKLLTAWNALMIRGMCVAGCYTGNPHYVASARRAIDFVRHTLWQDGRFFATSKQGRSHLNAYLDDYAGMLLALIDYLQCDWDAQLLAWARDIANALLMHFEDSAQGGFYFTSHDHEQLIQRSKSFSDDAVPAGNGVASFALQRLGWLLGDTEYLAAAERCLQMAAPHLNQHAVLHCSMLDTLEEYLNPPSLIILRGETETLRSWQQAVQQYYLPRCLCFAIPSDSALPDTLNDKKPLGDGCAYICEGTRCLPPVTELNELLHYLRLHHPHMARHENTQPP